jgi:thiamine-monophosphate kinase
MSSDGDVAMGPGREFDAIRRMVADWGELSEAIGDDAALLQLPRGDAAVITVDTCIESVHFRRGWITPREIGWRAGAAAISDIAAMGARPRALLLAIGIPDPWRESLAEITQGIGDVARRAGTAIIGGNTSRAGELSLTCTVIGSVHGPGALKRDGVRPGDRIYVTGQFGGPGAAVRSWLAGAEPDAAHRERFARPVPRVDEGLWLASRGVTAAIDVSDGLASDLGHLAAASSVGIDVQAEALPMIDGVTCEEAFTSGEEYELVVAAGEALDTGEFRRRFSLELTEIGRAVTRASDGDTLVQLIRGGDDRVAGLRGHDHFSG